MTKAELENIVAEHGLTIDDTRAGASKFVDVYIGTGADMAKLVALKKRIIESGTTRQAVAGLSQSVVISRVTNPDHQDYGKAMLEVQSMWWE